MAVTKSAQVETNKSHHFSYLPTPVVFVPGIMGSRVEFQGKSDTIVWDPDSLPRQGRLAADMRLFESVTSRQQMFLPTSPGVVLRKPWAGTDLYDTGTDARTERGWHGVLKCYYGDVLRRLQRQLSLGRLTASRSEFLDMSDPVVYACGYDFRQDNGRSALRLHDFIRDQVFGRDGHDKCVILSHSMGGLVSRAMFAEAKYKSVTDRVAGAIHVGQPVDGAAKAYRWLATGPDGALAWLFGEGDAGKQVMAVIPAVFQLLPNQLYRPGWLRIGSVPPPIPDPYPAYEHGVPGTKIPPLYNIPEPPAAPSEEAIKQQVENILSYAGSAGSPPSPEVRTWVEQDVRARLLRECQAAHLPWQIAKDAYTANIAIAGTFHEMGRAAHSRTRTLAIGSHVDTDVGIDWNSDGLTLLATPGPGDATVPLESASALPPTVVVDTEAQHDKMMGDASVIAEIVTAYYQLTGAGL